NGGLKYLGDSLRSVWKIEDALALTLLSVDNNAVGFESLAYRVGDHQRETGCVDDGRNRSVDLAIGFVERNCG
ncbi:MAG: hypothetical protein QOK07_12, partial [Gemmatimonadaceae bacterium]|nr:hypothetical protein [Gemmatimonadaceae bacterium]